MSDLPDDLLLNCLARVSRLYYPTLSLVSKRFRSIIASTELYKTRRLIGSTESCPYVCLEFAYSCKWLTLSRGPTRIPRRLTSCFSPCRIVMRNLMIPVPSQDYCTRHSEWKSATIGSSIYMIGGYVNQKPTSRVFVMDCGSHTCHEAPSMQVARGNPRVSVVDGKIYVLEGRQDCNSSSFMEIFDPETQIWEHAPNPGTEISRKHIYITFAYQGNLYLIGEDNTDVVYKPKENKWELELINGICSRGFVLDQSCMIDNVLYSYDGGSSRSIVWYDSKKRSWRAVKGLKDLRPKLPDVYLHVRLMSYGRKIVAFWEQNIRGKKMLIWCAEIEIERRNRHEICGKVIWYDVVLTVPDTCSFRQLHLATV